MHPHMHSNAYAIIKYTRAYVRIEAHIVSERIYQRKLTASTAANSSHRIDFAAVLIFSKTVGSKGKQFAMSDKKSHVRADKNV